MASRLRGASIPMITCRIAKKNRGCRPKFMLVSQMDGDWDSTNNQRFGGKNNQVVFHIRFLKEIYFEAFVLVAY